MLVRILPMKKLVVITLTTIAFISCKYSGTEKTENSVKTEFHEIKRDYYQLSKPTNGIESVLVL